MRCPNCNQEVNSGDTCPYCETPLNQVKVLSPEERENFEGITIDQEEQDEQQEQYRQQGSYRVYVKQVDTGSTSVLTKVLLALFIAFFLFVALPMTIVIVAGIAIIWWLYRMFLH